MDACGIARDVWGPDAVIELSLPRLFSWQGKAPADAMYDWLGPGRQLYGLSFGRWGMSPWAKASSWISRGARRMSTRMPLISSIQTRGFLLIRERSDQFGSKRFGLRRRR